MIGKADGAVFLLCVIQFIHEKKKTANLGSIRRLSQEKTVKKRAHFPARKHDCSNRN